MSTEKKNLGEIHQSRHIIVKGFKPLFVRVKGGLLVRHVGG